jgi:hypothetical protein
MQVGEGLVVVPPDLDTSDELLEELDRERQGVRWEPAGHNRCRA